MDATNVQHDASVANAERRMRRDFQNARSNATQFDALSQIEGQQQRTETYPEIFIRYRRDFQRVCIHPNRLQNAAMDAKA